MFSANLLRGQDMTTYVTKSGDMWDGIAKEVYGDEMKADILMQANPDYLRTIIFSAGTELSCPEITFGSDISLPAWRQ